jgi:hypothetical protein
VALFRFDEFVVQLMFWTGIFSISATSVFWPWWRSSLGQTIVLEMGCLSIATLPSALHLEADLDTSDTFWRWWVAITFLVASLGLLWRVAVLWKYQHEEES